MDVGTRVKRGQLLARLADDSLQNDLHKQQALLAQAQATLDQATSNVQRAKLAEGSGGLSAQAIEQYRITEATARAALASAQADLDATQLKFAPDTHHRAGRRPGVNAHRRAGQCGERRQRAVPPRAPEPRGVARRGRCAPAGHGQGRPARQRHTAHRPGRGRPRAPRRPGSEHRDAAAALVYVSLAGDGAARVGMFASGSIELPAWPALTLPQSALVSRDGRDYVYTVDAAGKAHSAVVTVGRRQQQRVEVLSGVAANARVVASGGAFLSGRRAGDGDLGAGAGVGCIALIGATP